MGISGFEGDVYLFKGLRVLRGNRAANPSKQTVNHINWKEYLMTDRRKLKSNVTALGLSGLEVSL